MQGHTFTLKEVMHGNHPVRPFVHHLFEMEPRIRLHEFVDDLSLEKFFFVTDQHIHIPYVFPPVEHEIAHLV